MTLAELISFVGNPSAVVCIPLRLCWYPLLTLLPPLVFRSPVQCLVGMQRLQLRVSVPTNIAECYNKGYNNIQHSCYCPSPRVISQIIKFSFIAYPRSVVGTALLKTTLRY